MWLKEDWDSRFLINLGRRYIRCKTLRWQLIMVTLWAKLFSELHLLSYSVKLIMHFHAALHFESFENRQFLVILEITIVQGFSTRSALYLNSLVFSYHRFLALCSVLLSNCFTWHDLHNAFTGDWSTPEVRRLVAIAGRRSRESRRVGVHGGAKFPI